MTCAQWLISTGLILDIFGVVLLYRYGLPSSYPKAATSWDYEPTAEREKNLPKRKGFECRSHSGLAALVLGFILQIVGTVSAPLGC